jgi:hypothetical protein
MHIHLIASIRQANIYRSIGDEKGIFQKALAHGGLHPQFVESTYDLQSIEYEKRWNLEKLLYVVV